MFPTKTELLEKIRLGEDSFLELTEARFSGARVSAPERNDLPPRINAPGLRPEPTLVWKRDPQGALIQDIVFK